MTHSRRQFLGGATVAVAALGIPRRGAAEDSDDDVPATEDLMREHGILRRLLLVYREVIRKLEAKQEVKPEIVSRSAEIVRAFIEDYHERDEEEFIFPRFQKGQAKLTELVDVLLLQHRAGRTLTAEILRQAGRDRQRLVLAMTQFVRMYEPHAAREDTVLFPAFRWLIGPKELDKLKDVFEDKEKALPGGGFEKRVDDVAAIERALGIEDLALFTPKLG
jgi:hemerythrin-like domain-containing protein